ncbi:MAG: AtpZ/AtpI family protein [Thermodesulfovibrionia bacterium]|nr:AtpZ/AtpI family protein [Thermodesulfovibrionia bacterium]
MAEKTKKKETEGKSEKGELFRALGSASMIGINLVTSTFVGFAIGHWVLDRYLHTDPWFTIIFLLLGIASGFKHLYKVAMKQSKDNNDESEIK